MIVTKYSKNNKQDYTLKIKENYVNSLPRRKRDNNDSLYSKSVSDTNLVYNFKDKEFSTKMQNLEYRKNKLFKVIKEIKQEELFNSLEKMIYDLVEYSNPALKYVKTIKEKFDVNLLISEQGFSMQNIKNIQGKLADEDSFESLLNDLN